MTRLRSQSNFKMRHFSAKVSSESSLKRNLKTVPVVDALILRLEGEKWPDDEAACFETTLQILNGVKNDTLWATWVWDSMQLPLGVFYGSGSSLGNFDQCIKTPWSSQHELRTQYCLVEVKIMEPKETRVFGAFDSADDYLNTLSKTGRTFNHITFGVCMPAICSPSSVAKFSRHMLQLTHIPDAEEMTVDPGDCQNGPEPLPGRFHAFLSVFAALISIVIITAIYTYYNDNRDDSIIDSIAKSFSMTHNWTSLFKVNKNEIRVLNGMRVISAIAIVSCHQFFFMICKPGSMINSFEVDTLLKKVLGQGLIHIELVVDTFLVISGLLLIKGLMGGKQKNLLLVLLNRYFRFQGLNTIIWYCRADLMMEPEDMNWNFMMDDRIIAVFGLVRKIVLINYYRLIGPYVAITFYIMCMAQYTASGPVWLRSNAIERDVCEKYWWKNIFMLGYDMKTMCFMVGWQVNCDYHLAILTVFLFWIYRRSNRSGIVAFISVSCALTVQLAVMAYRKRLPLVPFDNISALAIVREYEVFNDLYIRWHDRAGSYLVGVALGWFMSLYKPENHRNVISKTTSFIIVLLSLFVMMKAATINHWFTDGRVEVAVAIATQRIVWAMAICALIVSFEYGRVVVISDFLCSSFFVPLSKLSYGINMTHFFIIQRNMHTMRSPFNLDIFNMIVCTAGSSVLACIFSLVLYILVEAPCMNLASLCFSERNDKAELNVAKESNVSIQSNGTSGTTKLKAS